MYISYSRTHCKTPYTKMTPTRCQTCAPTPVSPLSPQPPQPSQKQQTYRNLPARHPHTRNRHLHRDPKHASERLFAVLTMTHHRSCLLFTRESDRVGQFPAVAPTCEEQGFRGRELRCRGARVLRVDICHSGDWLDERAGNEVGEVGWWWELVERQDALL